MINLKQSGIPRGRMNLWKPRKPELYEAGKPDLVPDLPGGEGKLLCGVCRKHAPG